MIKELKKDKVELEENLLILIKDFEEKWGVMITQIDLEHYLTLSNETPKISEVSTEVKL